MPSLMARLVSFVLRVSGVLRRKYSGGPGWEQRLARVRRAPVPEPGARARRRLAVRRELFQGRPVWFIAPRDRGSRVRTLYLHGGGYVYTATPAHWNFLARLALKHGLSIVAPLYPLTPEAGCEEVTGFALDLYRELLSRHDGGDIVLAGDSAGGGLAVVVAALARREGLAAPAGLSLVCPWLDARAAHPDQPAIEPRDAILTLQGVRDIAPVYARRLDIDDPRVSPINTDFSGFPPIQLFSGGDDILVTDARALKAKQPDAEYWELPGMIHDWPIFGFPESHQAQERMAEFIKRVAGRGAGAP
jgi:monoterpene epsilon-lactone hydrolase